RSVNIALVNELARLCSRMKIDIWEVIDAAATKPFGFMSFRPGPGLGGHCIPIDPFYLTWKAREYDFTTEFIELAGKVNQSMPYYCRSVISQALNHGAGKSLAGSRVLVLGVSYKPDIGDVRAVSCTLGKHCRAKPGNAPQTWRQRRQPSAECGSAAREPKAARGMTRVGVAGLGYWGPNLARNFDELAELAWLCDISPDQLTLFRGRYP